jgi:hypothetical protein
LQSTPGCSDPIKSLRRLLKTALRRDNLKCTDIRDVTRGASFSLGDEATGEAQEGFEGDSH